DAVVAEPMVEPDPPRRRTRWIVAVVAVLAVVAALIGGHAWGASGTTSVWLTSHDVAAGQRITAADVSRISIRSAPRGAHHNPVGSVADRTLPGGTVVTSADVLAPGATLPGTGTVLVG